MLKKITLSHFRQHQDRSFEFGPGLNAIRGENEAGKTTVLEAFTYFCFGTGALRESLEHVVTYHQPVSKLRVGVEIEHLGVTYTGYRGKSGAEITFAGERITGQREVTKFFERLFGTSADMAGKLMFASQKSLAESLKAGPTEAGRMIEDLANFDLIDRVAEAIATRRTTGATAGVEGRIEELQRQRDNAELEAKSGDLEALREEIVNTRDEVTAAEADLAALREQRTVLDVDAAKRVEHDHVARSRAIEELTFEIDAIEREMARPTPHAPTEAELAAARAAVEQEKHAERAAALHRELVGTDTATGWDESLERLEEDIAGVQQRIVSDEEQRQHEADQLQALQRDLAEVKRGRDVKVAQLEGRLIKETTCALCQKDLTDVPEVVRTNSDLARQIQEEKDSARFKIENLMVKVPGKEKLRDALIIAVAEQRADLEAMQAVARHNAKVEQLYARAADFIEVDRSVVPGQWRWTGPKVGEAVGGAINKLRHLETLQREAQEDAALRKAKAGQLEGLKKSRAADVAARQALDLEGAKDVLVRAADLDQKVRDVVAPLTGLQERLRGLEAALATKEALERRQHQMLAQIRVQLAAAEKELADMQRYNLLIKKVRAARPVITNKLWNIVLAGVSKHFSEVRGQESRITRADGMFKCNGFPVSGLSGSAEDMLGLAMRITLTKTFLPGIDMLQLDEPGAACSDARETRMLGMLSTLKFGQIVMISHNDLVDAVADRIITV